MNRIFSLFPPSILLCNQLTSAQVNLFYMLCNAGEEVSIERTEGNTGADMVGQPKSSWIWDEKIDNLRASVSSKYFASNDVGNQQEVSGSGATVLVMVKWSTTRTDLTGSGDEADLHLLGYLRWWLS